MGKPENIWLYRWWAKAFQSRAADDRIFFLGRLSWALLTIGKRTSKLQCDSLSTTSGAFFTEAVGCDEVGLRFVVDIRRLSVWQIYP